MGMVKKGAAAAVAEAPKEVAPAKLDSGTQAAVSRLKKTTETAAAPAAEKKFTGRDFDKEARGKTRCVQFEAALMSPAIAGMKFDTMEEYLKLVRQAADAGVAYTFGEEN